MTTIDPMNLSLKEFDMLDNDHLFSERYRARKNALISETARASTPAPAHRTPRALAAVLIAAAIAVPAGAYAAANHGDFFANAFGDAWRVSVPATEGVQHFDEPGKEDAHFTYPAEEFVAVDADVAESLMGDAVMDEPFQVTSADGHTLAITGAVRSEHAMVAQFTLEREGGVTALAWNDANANRGKGVGHGADAQMGWNIGGDEFIYIDQERSTPEKLYGYSYTVFGEALPAGAEPTLTVYDYSIPLSVAYDGTNDHIDELDVETHDYAIPCTQVVESLDFANAAGGTIELSPLGLALDNETGLFKQVDDPEAYSMAADPAWTLAVVVNLADGTSYTVFDDRADLDNTTSLCCFDKTLVMAFNRLIDPAAVTSIDVVVADGDDPDAFLTDGEWLTADKLPTKTVTYTLA